MASKAIGKEKILAVSMPCNSQNSDIEDAELVAKNFGVKNIKVDLSNTYNGMEREINLKLDQNLSKESTINIKTKTKNDNSIRNCTDFRIFSDRNGKSL